MAWKLDNIDFLTYGVTVSQATGVLDIPEIEDATHSWLDSSYSVAVRDTDLPTKDRTITLVCVIRATSYSGFKTAVGNFAAAIHTAGGYRDLYHPYSTTPIPVFVKDEINIDKLTNWDNNNQIGRFTVNFIVEGDHALRYMLILKRTDGTVRSLVVMGKDAVMEQVHMGIDQYSFTVESTTPLPVQRNDYILINNIKYIHFDKINFKKESTNKYIYKFKFEHEIFKLRNVLVKNLDGFTEFYYNSIGLDEIVDLICENANVVYPNLFAKGILTYTQTKNYHIKSESCYDLLKRVCEDNEIEFNFRLGALRWNIDISPYISYPITNTTDGGLVNFQYGEGNGLYSMDRELQNKDTFCNKLYVYGGTKNLPFGSVGLRLASTLNPFMNSMSISAEGVVEKDKIFEEVYPRGVRSVTSFQIIPPTMSAGVTNITNGIATYTPPRELIPGEFIVHDETIDFDINELLTKDPAKLVFNTGQLAGYEFVIKRFDFDTKKIYLRPIIDETGRTVPNEVMQPNTILGVMDEFIVINITPPSSFTAEALIELNQKGALYFEEVSVSNYNYTIVVDPVFAANLEYVSVYEFSDILVTALISLTDTDYGLNNASYRIIKKTKHIYTDVVDFYATNTVINKSASLPSQIKSTLNKLKTTDDALGLSDVRHKRTSTETVGDFKAEIISDTDGYLIPDKIRPHSIDPIHLALDSGMLQYSISKCLVEMNHETDPNEISIGSGAFHCHNFYAKSKYNIKKLKDGSVVYDPSRSWYIYAVILTLLDDLGYWLYVRAPLAEGYPNATLMVSSDRLDPFHENGYILFQWGYLHPVYDGVRIASLLWGNLGISGAAPPPPPPQTYTLTVNNGTITTQPIPGLYTLTVNNGVISGGELGIYTLIVNNGTISIN